MLTYKQVNKALAALPGYAGEILVQGNGYLYFMDGNAHKWETCAIAVCRLNHTTLQSVLETFAQYVQDYANTGRA